MFTFFFVHTHIAQPRKTYEVLGGLASRYSQGLIIMLPYVQAFHHSAARCGTRPNATLRMNSQTHFCVEMWRITVFKLWLDRECLSRPIWHITAILQHPIPILISDASPWKLVAAIFTKRQTASLFQCLAKLSAT